MRQRSHLNPMQSSVKNTKKFIKTADSVQLVRAVTPTWQQTLVRVHSDLRNFSLCYSIFGSIVIIKKVRNAILLALT